MGTIRERILAKTLVGGQDECWEWQAAKNNKGYGVIHLDGKVALAHRVSYAVFIGDIPEGKLIRHRCDNPGCVNPSHLVPGTIVENTMDALERQRYPIGFANSNTRLSEADVRSILLSPLPAPEIAAGYGVTADYIYMIQRGVRRSSIEVEELPTRTMKRRLHGRRGEGHYRTSLTDDKVMSIRSDRRTHQVIADEYGISRTTVFNIKNRLMWTHIPPSAADAVRKRTPPPISAPCKVDGCEGNSSTVASGAKGLCRKHYHRLIRYGDPTFSPRGH